MISLIRAKLGPNQHFCIAARRYISKHHKVKLFAKCFSQKSLECFSPIKEINRINWKLGKLSNPLWCRVLKWRDFEEIFKCPPVRVALNRSTSLCRPKPPHPLQLCHWFNPKRDFGSTNISSSCMDNDRVSLVSLRTTSKSLKMMLWLKLNGNSKNRWLENLENLKSDNYQRVFDFLFPVSTSFVWGCPETIAWFEDLKMYGWSGKIQGSLKQNLYTVQQAEKKENASKSFPKSSNFLRNTKICLKVKKSQHFKNQNRFFIIKQK